jgi:hypothetical protein
MQELPSVSDLYTSSDKKHYLELQDDQNNSRLPTEGPMWTAELATDPNHVANGKY